MRYAFTVTAPPAVTRLKDCFFGHCGEHEIGFTSSSMVVDGQPRFGISGEMHFTRVPRERWLDTLRKMKAGGLNVVATYIFWIHHEEKEGEFDFSGQRDLRGFLQAAQEAGLQVILRVGPFCHGEVRNGGLPEWLYGKPFEVRALNEGFMRCVKRLFEQIAQQAQGMLYKDGGCVIGIQLENEYMHSSAMWEHTRATTKEYANASQDGDAYLLYLRDLLREVGLDAPFYTCTAWGGAAAPYQEALPLWGGYPYAPWLVDEAHPIHPATEEFLYRDCRNPEGARYHSYDPRYDPRTMPFACCEMGPGMQVAYAHRFQCDPRAADALANVKVGSGCNFVGYYMFAGGTNPTGKVFPWLHEEWCPKLSYDYQAPIGEFGQMREAYCRLRVLHYTLTRFESELCPMEPFLPDALATDPHDTRTLRCAVRSDGEKGFLFLNAFQDHVDMPTFEDEDVRVNTLAGEVAFPTIRLAAGESCVLPFGFTWLGTRLECATVQPLALIPTAEGATLYAMRPEGMRAALRFADGQEVAFADEPVQRARVRLRDGALTVVALSREAASRFYLDGDDGYLCEGGVLWRGGDGLMAEGVGGALRVVSLPSTETVWQAEAPSSLPRVRYERLTPNRWSVELPDWQPESDVRDLMLHLRYDGDVGQLFTLGGTLVADNFCNGSPWEIGLNALLKRTGGERMLTLVISPRKEGTVVSRDAMAAITERVQRQIAEVEGIEARAWVRHRV